MDPQLMQMLSMLMQQQGPREHPLTRAFGGAPMYGGIQQIPSQMFDLSGIPGFQGNSQFGQMTGMAMQSVLPSLMGPNFVPGQFAPTQNLADHRYALEYFLQRRQAMATASAAEAQTYFRMIRGAARMKGVNFEPGGEREQFAQRAANDLTNLTPFLADAFPDFVDQIAGVRGSPTGMAGKVFDGGRYTFDPATGRLGLSGASAGAMSSEMFNMLYGPGANLANMRGLGATRAGQMFDELTRRGFGPDVALNEDEARMRLRRELSRDPSDIRSPELRALRASLGDKAGLRAGATPEEAFGKLGAELDKLNPQAFEAAQRSFNASRAVETFGKMNAAVAAMRDIFGDMGRPNAPMIELINGIQTLTQGGMSHMSPAQLERTVRESYSIAKYTGLGLEGFLGMQGAAAQGLAQLGLNPSSAWQIAQGSASYGFAFGLSGRPTNFGNYDKEQATQIDMRLRAQAMASPQAVRLAGLMDLADTFVRQNGKVGFAEDTEAFSLSEAVRRGDNTYEYKGQTKSVYATAPRLQQIVGDAGVNRVDSARAFTMSPAAAQKYIDRYKTIGTLTREGQGSLDIAPPFSRVFANSAMTSLGGLGINARDRGTLGLGIGRNLMQEIFDLNENDPSFLNEGREADRNKELARRLRVRMGNELNGINDADLANLVGAAWRDAETEVKRPGGRFNNAPGFQAILDTNNKRVFALQRRARTETDALAAVQSALAAAGQTQLLPRLSDYLQNVGPNGGSINDFLLTAAGGIPTGEVSKAAGGLVEHIAGLKRQYDEVGDFKGKGAIKDPEKVRIARETILEQIRKLGPDVSRALQGDIANLSPEAQKILKDYQEKIDKDPDKKLIPPNTQIPAQPGIPPGMAKPGSGPISKMDNATFNDATVTIKARSLKIERDGVALMPAKSDTDDPMAEKLSDDPVGTGNRLSGTLTLIGLDKVLIDARQEQPSDTRSMG